MINSREFAYEQAILAAVPGAQAVWVGDTRGQAETAAVGAQIARENGWNGPLVFHNVDTVVTGRNLPQIGNFLGERDGYIDVFRADSNAYSYVALDAQDPPEVTQIAEKVVISPWATTGLYGFSSPEAYLNWMEHARPNSREFYISDVFAAILAAKGRIAAGTPTAAQQTIVLGTPAEYEAEVAKQWLP